VNARPRRWRPPGGPGSVKGRSLVRARRPRRPYPLECPRARFEKLLTFVLSLFWRSLGSGDVGAACIRGSRVCPAGGARGEDLRLLKYSQTSLRRRRFNIIGPFCRQEEPFGVKRSWTRGASWQAGAAAGGASSSCQRRHEGASRAGPALLLIVMCSRGSKWLLFLLLLLLLPAPTTRQHTPAAGRLG
jgi:hypothetical protein